MMSKNRRYAVIIILVVNGILISFLESFIPIPIPVPGVKLGLGNIITMIGIAFLGFKDVLFIVAVRCFVVAILTRGVMMLAFSLSGGILSAIVMAILYKKLSKVLNIRVISIAGAIAHSTTQVVIASFMLGEFVIMYYLPVLLISAVITGFITGSIGSLAIDEIRMASKILTEEPGLKDLAKKESPREESVEEEPAVEKAILDKIADKPVKRTAIGEMDGLIKLILAVVLAVVPFYCREPWSFALFAACLAIITLCARIKPRTLLLSAASYGIVVLFPYFFGLLISWIFSTFSHYPAFALQNDGYEIFLRLARLFLIWYISILYFNTTPIRSVIGMLDKLLTPLKWLGVQVEDYLKVIMCIMHELGEIGPELRKSWGETMRKAAGRDRRRFKLNIRGISNVLVSLIVNSFQKLDRVQAFVEQVSPEELYGYRFKIRKYDGVAMACMTIFFAVVSILEH